MRIIDGHQINECNQAITIEADEPDPKNGNASHCYICTIDPTKIGVAAYTRTVLEFQHGPIAEVGTNGITHEVLLAILVDRVEGFQSGPYACEENALALEALKAAQAAFHSRTKKRVERGVEGTHTV
jgi:hypothetical protein